MEFIFTLYVWSTVSYGVSYWRDFGEYRAQTKEDAYSLCVDGARQLSVPTERYRCIRSK